MPAVSPWRPGLPLAVPRRRQRTRWLANAEADHGRAILRRRAEAPEPSAGAAAAKAVDAHGPRRHQGARPGKDDARAGGAGPAPQTEPAESEAVSGDRTRPPPTNGPSASRGEQPKHRGLERVRVVAPVVVDLPADTGASVAVGVAPLDHRGVRRRNALA